MGHEYRGSIAGCFLLKLSHKVAIKLLAVAAVTSKLISTETLLPDLLV